MATIVAAIGAEEMGVPDPATAWNGVFQTFGDSAGPAAMPEYDIASARPGSGPHGYKFTYANSVAHFLAPATRDWTATNFIAGSGYFWADQAPAVTMNITNGGSVSSIFPDVRMNTDRTVVCRFTGGTSPTTSSATPALALNAWHFIEFVLDMSSTAWTLTVRINLGTSVVATVTAPAAATGNAWRIGPNTANAALNGSVWRYDDWVFSNVGADHPLGEYRIYPYMPNADGAHAVGAGTFKKVVNNGTDAGGTTITNATTDAWTVLDDWPQPPDDDATDDWVSKTAGTGSAEIVRIAFEDHALNEDPVAVKMVTAVRNDAGTLTNNLVVTSILGSTEETTAEAFSGSIGVATTEWWGRHWVTKPGGGAWTKQDLSDLECLIRSTDPSPVPRVRAVELQAVYQGAEPVTPITFAKPPGRMPIA